MLSIGARTKFPSHSLTEMYRQGIEREEGFWKGGRKGLKGGRGGKKGRGREERTRGREGWRGG